MAQVTATLQATHIYEVLTDGHAKYTYRNLTADSISPVSLVSERGSLLGLCLPDFTSLLGQHIIYGIKPTIRISTIESIYDISTIGLDSPYPVENPGSEEITLPKMHSISSDRNLVPNQEVYFDGPIASPGENKLVGYDYSASDRQISNYAFSILKNKAIILFTAAGNSEVYYRTLLNGTMPTITVFYDDGTLAEREIWSVSGPTSGYNNPRTATPINGSLRFKPGNVYKCLDTNLYAVKQTIYWRVSGAGSWNSYSEDITTIGSGINVPANTFPLNSTIEWYLSVKDNAGVTSTTETFSFTTIDSESYAIPESPVNSIELGNGRIRFIWTVENESGEPPSRVKAVWATAPDAAEWTELFDIDHAAYEFTADPDTFSGGDIYWKITSWNADGVQGETSDAAVFQCVAPPLAPTNVICDSAPFLTVSWQTDVQTAYEVSVDGVVVEKKFGIGVYSCQLSEPLSDGEHEVSVRVQGPYGYWSQPTMVVASVINAGTGTIAVNGRFDVDGDLAWAYTGAEDSPVFRVYRDGKLIARTRNAIFADRTVLGQHSYRILAELSGGYYCASNIVSGTMKSCITRISPVAGGDWLDLELSENSNGLQNFEWSRGVTLRHYAGAVYPVAEMSPYMDRVASYDCAFKCVQDAAAFEALRGQIVILKSRGGEVVIGPLSTLSKSAGDFYLSYRFNVQQIHWEDLIDDTYS